MHVRAFGSASEITHHVRDSCFEALRLVRELTRLAEAGTDVRRAKETAALGVANIWGVLIGSCQHIKIAIGYSTSPPESLFDNNVSLA